jgi:hypothetical protein
VCYHANKLQMTPNHNKKVSGVLKHGLRAVGLGDDGGWARAQNPGTLNLNNLQKFCGLSASYCQQSAEKPCAQTGALVLTTSVNRHSSCNLHTHAQPPAAARSQAKAQTSPKP